MIGDNKAFVKAIVNIARETSCLRCHNEPAVSGQRWGKKCRAAYQNDYRKVLKQGRLQLQEENEKLRAENAELKELASALKEVLLAAVPNAADRISEVRAVLEPARQDI